MPDQGARVRTLLATYARAGGRDARILVHGREARETIARIARRGRGLPARVIPLEVHHVASIGLDLWMAALAWGASRVDVLLTGDEAPQYREALAFQMRLGNTIAEALGYQGEHFRIVDGADPMAAERALWSAAPRSPCGSRRRSPRTPEKRTTLSLALDHLALHAPVPRKVIPLSGGLAVRSRIDVNRDTCTMCLACVGACPEGAILDHAEAPQLRFIESEVRAVRHLREDLPRARDHARPAARPDARSARAARAERGGDVRLHPLRQAARHAQDDRRRCSRSSRGHSMFAAPGALDRLRCAPTAASGDGRRRARRHRPQGREDLTKAPRPSLRPTRTIAGFAMTGGCASVACRIRAARIARARTSTRCWRGFSPTRPTSASLGVLARGAGVAGRPRTRRLRPAWNRLLRASRAMDADAARAGVHGPVRRRRQERGEPARVALAGRLHDGQAAGRAARRPGGLGLERRGSDEPMLEDHLSAAVRDDAAADRRRRRPPPAPLRRSSAFLRPPHRVLGVRLLHRNRRVLRLPITTAGSQNSPEYSWRSNVTRSPWADPNDVTKAVLEASHARRRTQIPAHATSPSSTPRRCRPQASPLPARARRGRRGRGCRRIGRRGAAVAAAADASPPTPDRAIAKPSTSTTTTPRRSPRRTGGSPCCSRANPMPRPPRRPA